jgi:hypothetical protein
MYLLMKMNNLVEFWTTCVPGGCSTGHTLQNMLLLSSYNSLENFIHSAIRLTDPVNRNHGLKPIAHKMLE